jgi:hypothetical protein
MEDVWQRELRLARDTARWGTGSVLAGLAVAGVGVRRGDRAVREFGLQNAGWGAVDVALAVLAERLRRSRMARTDDPRAPEAQAAERRRLRRVLLVNVALDAGYVVGGVALAVRARRRGDRGPAGAALGIVVQGAFLLVHDATHAAGLDETG